MADSNERDYFERRRTAMIAERSSFIAHYRELSDYVQPRRGRFFISDRNKGDRRSQSIINSKATQALRIARSGLLAGVMSPARPWFGLETPDPDLMEFQPVKIWLHKAEILIRAIFNGGNLYNMAPVMLGETLLFGTGVMLHVDDYEDVARFYTLTAGSYMIGQNERLSVTTLVREYEATVEQLVSQFGLDNVSKTVKDLYDKGSLDSWIPCVHFVDENPDFKKTSKLSKEKRFRSVYYEPGSADKNKFLSKAGYDEFPAYCPRWDVTGEDIYGTDCPGMTALGDVKALQLEEKRKAQAIDKMVDPPLKGPSSLRNVMVSTLPGGLTIYDGDSTREGLQSIYTVNPQIQELMMDIQAVERRIDTAFYADLFMAISSMAGIQPKNQLELSHRDAERLLQLGPVLERLHGEFLDPLINRTFNQCIRADLLPEPPKELQGQTLKVKYISTLAMAQRSVAAGGIERLAGFVGSLAGAGFPEVVDKFDADQAVDEYSSVIGVPPRVTRSDEVVEEIREARAQAQQAQQTLEAGQTVSQTVKNLGDAVAGEGSALKGLADATGSGDA